MDPEPLLATTTLRGNVARLAAYTVAWCLLSRGVLPTLFKRLFPQHKFSMPTSTSAGDDKSIIMLSDACSLVHAVLISYGSFYKLFSDDSGGNIYFVCFSGSYFVSDFILTAKLWTNDRSTIFHHALSMILTAIFINPRFLEPYDRYIPAYLVVEVSTIFLDFAKISAAVGLRKSRFNKLSAMAFAVTFFLFRVVYLPFVVYRNITVDPGNVPLEIVAVLTFLCSLQFYWFGLILKRLKKEMS